MPNYFDLPPRSVSSSYRRARNALRHVPARLLVGEREFHRGEQAGTVLYVGIAAGHPESSRNAGMILERVHGVAPLPAVMVETFQGAVDLAQLRGLTRTDLERHVDEGRLPGTIYFAALHDVQVYGVEDMALLREAQQAQHGAAQQQAVASAYLESLRAAVAQVAAPNDDARPLPLAQPKRWCGLLKNLLTLQLVYDDWQLVQAWLPQYGPGNFERELAASVPHAESLAKVSAGEVQQATEHATRFYHLATARGRAFAENTLRYLHDTGSDWVAGCWTGFQASVFRDTIREQGFSYLHIATNLTAASLRAGSVNLPEKELDAMLATSGEEGRADGFQQAISVFRQALQQAQARQHQDALVAFCQARELARGDTPQARQLRYAATTHIATAQKSLGDVEQAWTSLDEARAAYPEQLDASFYFLFAEAALASGRRAEAAAALSTAAAQLDDSASDAAAANLRRRAVQLYCELEDFPSFIKHCEWLIAFYEQEINRDMAGVFENNLGLAAMKLGDLERARAALDRSVSHSRAASLPEELAIALVNRSRVLIARGELALAEADLQEADRLLPEADPRHYRRLRAHARLRHAHGDVAGALQLARQVTTLPRAGITPLNREDDEAWTRELQAELENNAHGNR